MTKGKGCSVSRHVINALDFACENWRLVILCRVWCGCTPIALLPHSNPQSPIAFHRPVPLSFLILFDRL